MWVLRGAVVTVAMVGGMRLRGLALILGLLLCAPPVSATVTTSTHSVEYAGAGQTAFTVTFPFLSASQLVVTKINDSTLAETVLTLGTDYTVTLPGTSAYGSSTNGRVTTTAAVASGYTLRIERNTPLTQTTSFRTQGTFRPGAHEDAIDKLTMILQEQEELDNDPDVDAAIDDHEAASDPHTVYWKLAGRSGGQVGYGGTAAGEDAQIVSTTNGTKGSVILGSDGTELVVDDVNNRVGIGTAAPTVTLDVSGATQLDGNVEVTGTATVMDLAVADDATITDDLRVDGDTTMFGALEITGLNAQLQFDNTFNTPGIITGADYAGGGLNIRSTTDSTKGLIKLGSSGTELVVDDANDRVGIGTASPSVELDLAGGRAIMRRAYTFTNTSPVSVSATADCNRIYAADDNIEYDLPALSSSTNGCQITFIHADIALKSNLWIDPNGTDQVRGTCVSTNFSGSAGKGIRITGATADEGDYVTLVGVYTSATYPAWYIIGCVGTWTVEP